MKLGKLHPVAHPHTLRLSDYTAALPPHPETCSWAAGVDAWPLSLNDTFGCCTVSAAGHATLLWNHASGRGLLEVDDAAILAAYEEITGFRLDRPETDQGAVETAVLAYWRDVGIGGHKIAAWAACGDRLAAAVWMFGVAYLGVALPLSAKGAASWDVVGDSVTGDSARGSWGGHAVVVIGYSDAGLDVVTWGRRVRMSWAFAAAYLDEAYAPISPEWLRSDGIAPSGFDRMQLDADLRAIGATP